MDERDLRLDGNAAAGLLQELFVGEMTGALGRCGSCHAIAEIGAQHLYMYAHAPGGVLRCRSCESVLMVFVHADGRHRFGMPGLSWVEIAEPG